MANSSALCNLVDKDNDGYEDPVPSPPPVEPSSSTSSDATIVVAAVVSVAFLIIVVVFSAYKWRRGGSEGVTQQKNIPLQRGIKKLVGGQDEWEIQRPRVQLSRSLGGGAFGVVKYGLYKNPRGAGSGTHKEVRNARRSASSFFSSVCVCVCMCVPS